PLAVDAETTIGLLLTVLDLEREQLREVCGAPFKGRSRRRWDAAADTGERAVARQQLGAASAQQFELQAHRGAPPRLPSRMAAWVSRFASRSFMVWRLSYCFLPRASAISTLARPFLK